MNSSTSFRLIACLAVIAWLAALLAVASACTPSTPPPPASVTPAQPVVESPKTNGGETPVNTPGLVAFPTAPAATFTAPAPTLTLSAAPLSEGRSSSAAPVVQVVSPLPGAQVSISQTVYVVAYAASDSAIARIELSDDSVPVRTETPVMPLPTFSTIIPWTPAQTGAHVLRVVAFDASNRASAPEEVTVTVVSDTRRPTSSILYPLGQPQVELGSVLQVYAVSTDEVGVKRFDLWVDNQPYTYVFAPNSSSSATLPTIFAWTAVPAGNHTLFVRATDTQDQTNDSPPLKVFVVDTHSPTLSVSFDRSSVGIGEPVTITVTALDVSGIQRIELWTGKEISNTIASANAAHQTSMSAQFAWSNGAAGDYSLTARAYNVGGSYKESPAHIMSVLRSGQPTPTRTAPTPTRTRTPRPPPTSRLQPPAAPSVEISQPGDRFVSQGLVRVVYSARASAELDRVEVWGYYQGELNPQLICTVDAHNTTSKNGQCDWSPYQAGAVFLFAQVVDNFQQSTRSPTISGIIGVPALPTPTAMPISVTGRWSGAAPAGQYVVVFRPIATTSGVALRGDFKIVSAATPSVETTGRVVSGSVKGDRVTFRAEFAASAGAASTPSTDTPPPTAPPTATAAAPAIDLDCGVDLAGTVMDCKFKDARGQTGAVTFRREGP